MDDLNGRPKRHPVKAWVARANAYLDEDNQITLSGIARRCGQSYSYTNGFVNGYVKPNAYVESMLGTVIAYCKEIIARHEVEDQR